MKSFQAKKKKRKKKLIMINHTDKQGVLIFTFLFLAIPKEIPSLVEKLVLNAKKDIK